MDRIILKFRHCRKVQGIDEVNKIQNKILKIVNWLVYYTHWVIEMRHIHKTIELLYSSSLILYMLKTKYNFGDKKQDNK